MFRKLTFFAQVYFKYWSINRKQQIFFYTYILWMIDDQYIPVGFSLLVNEKFMKQENIIILVKKNCGQGALSKWSRFWGVEGIKRGETNFTPHAIYGPGTSAKYASRLIRPLKPRKPSSNVIPRVRHYILRMDRDAIYRVLSRETFPGLPLRNFLIRPVPGAISASDSYQIKRTTLSRSGDGNVPYQNLIGYGPAKSGWDIYIPITTYLGGMGAVWGNCGVSQGFVGGEIMGSGVGRANVWLCLNLHG